MINIKLNYTSQHEFLVPKARVKTSSAIVSTQLHRFNQCYQAIIILLNIFKLFFAQGEVDTNIAI